MEIAILVLLSSILLILLALVVKIFSDKKLDILETLKSDNSLLRQELTNTFLGFVANIENTQKNNSELLDNKFKTFEFMSEKKLEDIKKIVDEKLNDNLNDKINLLANLQREAFENQVKKIEIMQKSIITSFDQFETRFKTFESMNEEKLENIRTTIEKRLSYLQEDNNKKLDEMRKTVDEKLQETLQTNIDKSFKLVSERLELVHKGLGEMQNLAVGVGDLKKVLSNVKNRGIVGEVQLAAILEDILTRAQYDVNVITKKGSNDRVEFAIKLPVSDNKYMYLPIDAKFHGDTFASLQDAYNVGEKVAIDNARKVLRQAIEKSAKDIRDKYIDVPNTTEFAIMFLPFESLYAEVVNLNLIGELQSKYRVVIAGPSTMAMMLNSFQMGFRMLTLQERSQDVWKILSEVKIEFGKFESGLTSIQKKLRSADEEVEKLITTRTNAINRKFKNIELEESQNQVSIESILQLEDDK